MPNNDDDDDDDVSSIPLPQSSPPAVDVDEDLHLVTSPWLCSSRPGSSASQTVLDKFAIPSF